MNLSNHVPILFWPVCFGFGTLLVRDIWRNRLSPQILIYLGVMGLFASQALGWIVRPGSIYWYKKYAPGMPWWGMRESFTLAFAGYLLWSLYFGRVSKKAGVIFVVVYFLLMPSFWVKPYGEVSYWKRVAADLDQSIKTGCPKQVRVKYFPTNWQFDYVSQQPEAAHCH